MLGGGGGLLLIRALPEPLPEQLVLLLLGDRLLELELLLLGGLGLGEELGLMRRSSLHR